MTRNEMYSVSNEMYSVSSGYLPEDMLIQRSLDEEAINSALENLRLVKRIESRYHFNDRDSMFNRVLVDEFGALSSKTPIHVFDL